MALTLIYLSGMLDDYCKIAKKVASDFNVPYLDFRGSLKKAIPWYRLWYAGYVTKDGEHTNERGTWILADIIAKQFLVWFEQYNSTTYFRRHGNNSAGHFQYELDDNTF